MFALLVSLMSLGIFVGAPSMVWANTLYFPVTPATADHSQFKELRGPFKQPEEVTKACLKCHNKVGEQMQKSLHWTWNWPGPSGRKLGKAHVINNF